MHQTHFKQTLSLTEKMRNVFSVSILYLEWFHFRFRFLNYEIAKYINRKELVMQRVRNIQRTKDTGYESYHLFAIIFQSLGIKPNSTCKGIWIWEYEGERKYVVVATYEFFIESNSNKPLQILNQYLIDSSRIQSSNDPN